VDLERIGEDVLDGHPGVQRGGGVLEHHGDGTAEFLAHGGVAFDGRFTVEEDLPGGGRLQAHQHRGQRGLAAPGFTHDANGFAAADGEVHPVDGLDDVGAEKAASACAVVDFDVFELDDRFAGGNAHFASSFRWLAQ
jgi:hypothetical protein